MRILTPVNHICVAKNVFGIFFFFYSDVFSLVTGCEFFRDFKDNEYNAEGLHFNWQQVRNKKIFFGAFTLSQDDKLDSMGLTRKLLS